MGSTSKSSKDSKPITWLSVFDGHGGAEASQFCSDWLSSYVRKDKEYPSNIANAMKSAFTKVRRIDLFHFMCNFCLKLSDVDNAFHLVAD